MGESKKGITWAQFVAADIDAVLENCNTFEDLVKELQDIGWEVKWKTKDGQRDLILFSTLKEATIFTLNHAV